MPCMQSMLLKMTKMRFLETAYNFLSLILTIY